MKQHQDELASMENYYKDQVGAHLPGMEGEPVSTHDILVFCVLVCNAGRSCFR